MMIITLVDEFSFLSRCDIWQCGGFKKMLKTEKVKATWAKTFNRNSVGETLFPKPTQIFACCWLVPIQFCPSFCIIRYDINYPLPFSFPSFWWGCCNSHVEETVPNKHLLFLRWILPIVFHFFFSLQYYYSKLFYLVVLCNIYSSIHPLPFVPPPMFPLSRVCLWQDLVSCLWYTTSKVKNVINKLFFF